MSSSPNSSSNTEPELDVPAAPGDQAADTDVVDASGRAPDLFDDVLKRHADVRLELSCELGGSSMRLRALLALTEGSVVVVDSPVGEDLRLRLNGVPFGHADVMVADSKVLLRLTEMCDGS